MAPVDQTKEATRVDSSWSTSLRSVVVFSATEAMPHSSRRLSQPFLHGTSWVACLSLGSGVSSVTTVSWAWAGTTTSSRCGDERPTVLRADRPLEDALSSCGVAPVSDLSLGEGRALALGRFDRIGVAAMAAGAAVNAIEIADGK